MKKAEQGIKPQHPKPKARIRHCFRTLSSGEYCRVRSISMKTGTSSMGTNSARLTAMPLGETRNLKNHEQ
ncbi:hypothetical protein O9929_11840 [Vibrio lentus]|nr:hypothetical protein [Vibrio lentus]